MDHLEPDTREHRVSRDGRPSKQDEEDNVKEKNEQSGDLDRWAPISVWKRMYQGRCSTGAHDHCVPGPGKVPGAYPSGGDNRTVLCTYRMHSFHDLRGDATDITN